MTCYYYSVFFVSFREYGYPCRCDRGPLGYFWSIGWAWVGRLVVFTWGSSGVCPMSLAATLLYIDPTLHDVD